MRMWMLLGLFACRGDDTTKGGGADPDTDDPYDVQVGPYDAEIRWTSYGIPHIEAADYGSVAYGLGYAFAQDHACVLADQIVMVRSERARYFGEEWVDMDLGWLALGVREQAEAGWSTIPAQIQEGLVGYAAGYNRWLEEDSPDPRCNGAAWVQPIDHIDLLSYYLALGLYGSGVVFVENAGSGVPPGAAADSRGGPRPAVPDIDVLRPLVERELGSNGWAIGRDRTESGGGLLLSNTHFPAEGERKWHESHLVIPGELDVYGASLMGVPLINVGFTPDVAWTHTVSNAPRFTGALLILDPDDPTRYEYDGGYEQMTSRDHSIEVLGDDGTLSTVTRTLYTSHWGPVLNAPVLGWTEQFALALTDANANNVAMLETWFQMNRATSMAEFQAAHRDIGGIPWVHTMAVDKEGTAFYVDSSTVPRWSEAAEARFPEWLGEQPLAAIFNDNGAIVVDGRDPVFEWVSDDSADAWRPDVVPWALMPRLERTDFVYNANDNHWLSNTDETLEGYSSLYGSERTARSPRTRMNARYLSETGPDSASGDDGAFSLEELEAAALGGRGSLADDLRAEVAAACDGVGTVTVDDQEVDVTLACETLAAWDGTASLDQAGAALWREVIGGGQYTYDDLRDAGELMTVPFDPTAPVETPHTLNTDGPILTALGQAVRNLDAAGAGPDVRLDEIQFQRKGDTDLPVPGGQDYEGVIAIATYSSGNATLLDVEPRAATVNGTSDLTEEGYQINYGNSFVMAVELTDSGARCRAVMTYSQSDDPSSPHFDDQTALYGDTTMRDCQLTEDAIAADTIRTVSLTLE